MAYDIYAEGYVDSCIDGCLAKDTYIYIIYIAIDRYILFYNYYVSALRCTLLHVIIKQ